VLSLSSEESAQEGETSQEWQPTPQVEHKLQNLNNFLRRTSDRSVLDAIAPGNSTWLFEQAHSTREIIEGISNTGEATLVSRVVTCFEEAGSWYNRQQILSLFAGDDSKTELLQMIPGLNKWRINEARKHAFKIKPGQPIEPPMLQRTHLDPVKVDHFLDFISSPSFLQDVAYGTRYLKLSIGEKIEMPSVVRTIILATPRKYVF